MAKNDAGSRPRRIEKKSDAVVPSKEREPRSANDRGDAATRVVRSRAVARKAGGDSARHRDLHGMSTPSPRRRRGLHGMSTPSPRRRRDLDSTECPRRPLAGKSQSARAGLHMVEVQVSRQKDDGYAPVACDDDAGGDARAAATLATLATTRALRGAFKTHRTVSRRRRGARRGYSDRRRRPATPRPPRRRPPRTSSSRTRSSAPSRTFTEWIFRGRVAATPRPRRGYSAETGRGDAAAATWRLSRRRGRDVEIRSRASGTP